MQCLAEECDRVAGTARIWTLRKEIRHLEEDRAPLWQHLQWTPGGDPGAGAGAVASSPNEQ